MMVGWGWGVVGRGRSMVRWGRSISRGRSMVGRSRSIVGRCRSMVGRSRSIVGRCRSMVGRGRSMVDRSRIVVSFSVIRDLSHESIIVVCVVVNMLCPAIWQGHAVGALHVTAPIGCLPGVVVVAGVVVMDAV